VIESDTYMDGDSLILNHDDASFIDKAKEKRRKLKDPNNEAYL
jgi:hypothetical protein